MKLMPRGAKLLPANLSLRLPKARWKWVLLGLVLLAGAALTIRLTVSRHNNNTLSVQQNPKTYFYNYNVQLTKDSLAKKDYVTANNACLATSSKAYFDRNYDQSIAILQDCISKMPPAQVNWLTYYTLAQVAKQKSNNQLELQSLKSALTQAKLANSGAGATYLTLMQDRIKQLGG